MTRTEAFTEIFRDTMNRDELKAERSEAFKRGDRKTYDKLTRDIRDLNMDIKATAAAYLPDLTDEEINLLPTMSALEIQLLAGFDSAAELMDDEIREDLHSKGIDNKVEFLQAYCKAHAKKYGEDFMI